MSTEKSGFRQLTKNLIAGKNKADNREDRYAVAVYGDMQSSTCMYRVWTRSSPNISRVSFMRSWSMTVQSRVEKPEIRHN